MPQKLGCGSRSGFPPTRGWVGRSVQRGLQPPGTPAATALIGGTATGMMSSALKGKTRRKQNFVPIIELVFTVVVKYGIRTKIHAESGLLHNAVG